MYKLHIIVPLDDDEDVPELLQSLRDGELAPHEVVAEVVNHSVLTYFVEVS